MATTIARPAPDDVAAHLADARIILRNGPDAYRCRAVIINRHRALIETSLTAQLPAWFSLAIAPDFTPRPCAVTWRGQRIVKVALFE
ncbi:hypothetical protein J2X36_003924 [Methylobacterium sp. BE186]|uniref:hypothetical protein n=1 Tax=Methylobacterium sp. BE186 TaxID=2817715 RepID=UPI002855362A|nr:hypothetical protein [Methylobacterium sp. BE186]MDR7039151.1 hypothetical protein [Methylobacterium sp. BE186]